MLTCIVLDDLSDDHWRTIQQKKRERGGERDRDREGDRQTEKNANRELTEKDGEIRQK